MKIIPRTLSLLSVLALATCKVDGAESGDEQTDPAIAAQTELCVAHCFRPFACDGTREPAPGIEQECEDRCSNAVAVARDDDCTDQYQAILECWEAATCEELNAWAEMSPGAPCLAEEQAIEQDCPNVKVRHQG